MWSFTWFIYAGDLIKRVIPARLHIIRQWQFNLWVCKMTSKKKEKKKRTASCFQISSWFFFVLPKFILITSPVAVSCFDPFCIAYGTRFSLVLCFFKGKTILLLGMGRVGGWIRLRSLFGKTTGKNQWNKQIQITIQTTRKSKDRKLGQTHREMAEKQWNAWLCSKNWQYFAPWYRWSWQAGSDHMVNIPEKTASSRLEREWQVKPLRIQCYPSVLDQLRHVQCLLL